MYKINNYMSYDWITRPRKTFDDIYSRLDTIHDCDRRTDGHWPTAGTALHSVASEVSQS